MSKNEIDVDVRAALMRSRRFQFRVSFFPSAARNGNRARLTPREGPDRLEIDLPHFAILVGSAFWCRRRV